MRWWVKTKCFEVGSFEVIGIDQDRSGAPVALLAQGEHYCGPAFITLSTATRKSFWRYVETKRKSGVWVRPGLAATVRHLRGEKMLRHASLVDLRRH